tara:strand:+ start:1401 stop:1745 length:345 start_codon:yes stop_codon:yes gene_type:complete
MSDVYICKFLFGLLFVIILIKILKRHIRQRRPSNKGKTDYGMPSTRAGIVFFIAIYLLMAHKNISRNTKIIIISFALLSSYMKYYLKEHTIAQLICGGLVGGCSAYLFHNINIM